MGRRRNTATLLTALAAAFVTVVTVGVGASVTATAANAGRVTPPRGAATPTPGSGMGTAAAFANPKCSHDDPARFGVYGRLSSTVHGQGPVCVKVWKQGADNGGATSPGVTK